MKKCTLFVLAASAALGGFSADTDGSGRDRRPMALMVFFDGGRADGIFNADCPNLRRLMDGAWAEGYRCAWTDAAQNIFDAKTLSYANHVSILCGVTAAKHKVMNNDQIRTKGDKHGWPTWGARLAKARPELKVHAFFSDRNDRWIMPDPAVKMTLPDPKRHWRARNEEITRAAEEVYRGDAAPDAGLFFLSEPDTAGHYFGFYPSSKEYLEQYSIADARMGRVLAAIRSRPTFDREDWLIAFVTDHGGRLLAHGPDDGHCHTVPLFVVGRRVANGVLHGCPRTYDLAPTLLAHFGVAADGMDSRVIGDRATPLGDVPFEEALFSYEPFDRPGPLEFDAPKAKATLRTGYIDCLFTGLTAPSSKNDPPVSARYGRVAGRDATAAFCIGGSDSVFTAERPSFTLAFWMLDEGDVYEDDPIVLGNKNLYCFLNPGYMDETEFPGFAVFLRSKTDDGSRGVTLKYTAGDGRTIRSLGAFTPERGRWNFYAIAVHPEGQVLFYQGRSDGLLYSIAADYGDARWNGGRLMLGQDTTVQYVHGSDLCFDEFYLWKRSLSTPEIRRLFRRRGK